MQKVYAIVAVLAAATLSCTTVIAADLLAGPSLCTSCADQSEIVACECGCSDSSECGSSCGDCGSSCGGCGCGICCRHRAYIASFGYFNCSCRGSYKFPVPPQYTYHWPGMYSQQYMTEYTSPYRFPPLELPKFLPQEKAKIAVEPVIQSTSTDLRAVNPARLMPLPNRLSARPTPMSVRIKQKYGLK
jgi:hypothetical protein